MRRASRWSSTAGFILLVSGAVFGQSVAADVASEPVGILLTAPEFRRGIDRLPVNVIPHWEATYRVVLTDPDAESGLTRTEVRVFYVTSPVAEARAWAAAACRALSLATSGNGDYYYESPQGWSLLVAPTAETLLPVPCDFLSLFVGRFQFFLNSAADTANQASPGSETTTHGPAPEFPAVLIRAQ